jgi:hypothetical protein
MFFRLPTSFLFHLHIQAAINVRDFNYIMCLYDFFQQENLFCFSSAFQNYKQVSWFQNSFPLQPTDRRIMSSRGNRHSLNIRHVMQEDFGNYR